MASLHQLLAVKQDASKRANEIAGETKKTLNAKHLFSGSIKTYTSFDEQDTTKIPEEHEQLSYTVGEKLEWFAENFARIIDIEYQIDRSNEGASADVELDGFFIASAPAPFLLDMVGFLEKIRNVYSSIPVLDPKYQWAEDVAAGSGVFKTTEPEITYRSKKVLRHKVLYEATEQHPAQVEKWPEDQQVGKYTKRMWSGAVTPAQKAAILGRIDTLLEATKKALSKANDVKHETEKIADRIFNYIHGDLPMDGVYNHLKDEF